MAQAGATRPDGSGAIVRVERLEKYFGDNHVLRGCSFSVAPREVVCILGRSGSGKSTLLRCINFLEEPTAGEVEVDGIRVAADPLHARSRQHQEQIRQIRLRAQMLFQEFNVFPHMRAIENVVEAPIRVRGMRREEAIALGERYLDLVGLREKRDAYPAHLSGGEKQRVAIARALAMEPKVLLFDEPTSALDPSLVGEVIKVMEDLAHGGTTMIVVTHELDFARETADRVLFIEGGVFIEEGTPDQVLDAPKNPLTRVFLERFLREGRGAPAATTEEEPPTLPPPVGHIA